MADKDVSKAAEPPRPVHIGGESLADRILPHVKKILVGFILLAVLLSVVFTLRWVKDRKQQAQTEQLAEILTLARRPVHSATAPTPPTGGPESKDKDASFATASERATAVLDAMTKQGVQAGGAAFRGSLLMDTGKVDEAIAEYRKGQTELGIEGVLAREGLGLALETKATAEKDPAAQKKLREEALAAFVAMQPDDAGPRRAYALYHQGRILFALERLPEAKTAFEKAKDLGGATELPELIEQRLAAMGT